jgi:hypothetical protein
VSKAFVVLAIGHAATAIVLQAADDRISGLGRGGGLSALR